jgi:hypothetical protein
MDEGLSVTDTARLTTRQKAMLQRDGEDNLNNGELLSLPYGEFL